MLAGLPRFRKHAVTNCRNGGTNCVPGRPSCPGANEAYASATPTASSLSAPEWAISATNCSHHAAMLGALPRPTSAHKRPSNGVAFAHSSKGSQDCSRSSIRWYLMSTFAACRECRAGSARKPCRRCLARSSAPATSVNGPPFGLTQHHRVGVVTRRRQHLPMQAAVFTHDSCMQAMLGHKACAALAGGLVAQSRFVPGADRRPRPGRNRHLRCESLGERRVATAVVRVQVGIDETAQRLLAQAVAQQAQGLVSMQAVAGIYEQCAFGLVTAEQQRIVGREPTALENAQAKRGEVKWFQNSGSGKAIGQGRARPAIVARRASSRTRPSKPATAESLPLAR